jgi:hypothetical protein
MRATTGGLFGRRGTSRLPRPGRSLLVLALIVVVLVSLPPSPARATAAHLGHAARVHPPSTRVPRLFGASHPQAAPAYAAPAIASRSESPPAGPLAAARVSPHRADGARAPPPA